MSNPGLEDSLVIKLIHITIGGSHEFKLLFSFQVDIRTKKCGNAACICGVVAREGREKLFTPQDKNV